MVSRESTTHSFLLLCSDFGMLFSVDLFDFERTYAISTNVKSYFLVSFLCKTISPVRQDRYEYYEDYEDLVTVLFVDFETVPHQNFLWNRKVIIFI